MTAEATDFEGGQTREWVPSLRNNMLAGSLAILAGFGGFLVWGYTVQLDSASVASGSVVVDTRRKTVSHLEGGILRDLLVSEGQAVAAGEPLLRLENTQAQANLLELQSRRTGLLARLARLRAEQIDAPTITFPDELLSGDTPYASDIQRNETLLFEQRRETQLRSLDVYRKQVAVYQADAGSAAAQLQANAEQQALIDSQITAIGSLVNDGLATRTQLVDLQGKLSALVGDAGELAGARARAEQSEAGAELELSRAVTTWQSDIADAIQAARIELSGLDETVTAAADVLRRVEIVSPAAGIVTNIQVTTTGAVIGSGQPIMDIIPDADERIIEARIDPRDIDAVRVGADVQVRLPSYSMRQTAPLHGSLSYIAADQSVDERTSTAFYVVRATVSEDALAAAPDIALYPGMPADLLILNKPRRAIDYFLSPITDSISRSFHEE
ncbi:MAG: HlyD family type I secretion periplasmic adaptor subunit [Candidatus Devosia phytovorans]|uniref:Membrane fusion protein (MFP) family protein n=1 Tax=Candidatus Devosia phytovorans TaxID=3121372 RepID=A0AAJ5VS10_9HYPH|nr:HlyD family type I secretion periplasmic adaptor subunit [Devosia sp.]WEK03644.1 MAG: HlyD family type I secretion periplasmic adaptor subunit [Devosia sp.]